LLDRDKKIIAKRILTDQMAEMLVIRTKKARIK